MNRWEAEQKIVMKALKDPSFKKRLMESPLPTLREFFKHEKGWDLSFLEKVRIRVVEEKKEEWVLPLPFLPENDLSEKNLEKLFAGTPPQSDFSRTVRRCPNGSESAP